jgi:F-type H+-transporting ATPase subunit b
VRRLSLIAFLALAGFAVFAQEHQPAPRSPAERASNPAREERTTEPEGNLELWKWANFAILAGIFWWLIAKNAPQFFQARTEEIQKGIAAAAKLKREADERAAKVEARMASLQNEIEHLRADAKAEMGKEAERLRQQTEQYTQRIQARGEQEIEAISKHAEKDLRVSAAQLAIQLAEQRIRASMSGETQNALIDGFLRQLDGGAASPEARL